MNGSMMGVCLKSAFRKSLGSEGRTTVHIHTSVYGQKCVNTTCVRER